MALKTFNIDAEIYEQFSGHCKKNGISMSKKVENFIADEIEKIEKGMEMELTKKDDQAEDMKKSVERSFEKDDEHPLSKYC